MTDRYISRAALDKLLDYYRDLGRWNANVCDPDTVAVKQRQEADAQLDEAAAKLRREKCRTCQYALHNCNWRYVIGCDYIGRTGHARDRSGGPGICGSYEPRRPETRKERILRSEKKLEAAEADGVANKNKRRM